MKYDRDITDALRRERQLKMDAMKRIAEKQVRIMYSHGKTRLGEVYGHACRTLFENDDERMWQFLTSLKRVPVTIEEFLESKDFLGAVDMEIWPQIRRDVLNVNADIATGVDPIGEYIDSGATGTGKTAKAHITQAYQLYLLHCVENPQRTYGLSAQTPIYMSMAASDLSTTHDVLFKPFFSMVQNIPFFQRYTKWNKDKTSVIEFDNRVVVEPVNATTQGIIGRALIGVHVDECNYMSVVSGSSRSQKGDGRRGVYDQAEVFYRAAKLRRKSRFSSKLPVPGMTILSSSTRYLDDFLDRRIEEVRKVDEPGVRIFRHKQYEVQPEGRFKPQRFRLLVGTPEYATRILAPHEEPGVHYPERAQVETIPEDYRYEFTHRPEDALRDVCGIATQNLTPFITQRHKILDAVERWRRAGNAHPVARDNVDLVEHGMPVLLPDLLDADTETKRFVHIDLSKTKDRCGLAMVRVDRMVEVEVSPGVWQRLPHFVVELAISMAPSQARPLDYEEVRTWAAALQTVHGVPIYMITYDGFNSAESVQALRKIGIRSEVISMDTDDSAYQSLRRALYQDRLELAPNDILVKELVQLDRDEKNGKVDHPPKGSKDISDAVAGAIQSALTSRLYRNQTYYTDGKGNRVSAPT